MNRLRAAPPLSLHVWVQSSVYLCIYHLACYAIAAGIWMRAHPRRRVASLGHLRMIVRV